MKNHATTEKIIEACFEVHNELGTGFLEKIYENALLIALREKGLMATQQAPLKVLFRGQVVGEYFADLIIENSVLIELKALKGLASEHQAQTINYLKATGISTGLLINFGKPGLEIRRLHS